MKTCKGCGIEKPLEDFPKHKQMADGHLHFCKICTKTKQYAHRKTTAGKAARKREGINAREKRREWLREYKKTDKGKTTRERYRKKRDTLFPEKWKARNALNGEIREGRITPQPCFLCGEKAQAHHPSYAVDMWLCVTWLCSKHHNEIHNPISET